MSFLKTLFGGGDAPRRDDPTASWAPSSAEQPLPALDLPGRSFGALVFDKSDIHAASFLGRPKGFKHRGQENFDIKYPDRGLMLTFELGMFAELLLACGPTDCASIDAGWERYGRSEILVGGGKVLPLAPETSRADVESALGAPKEADEDEDEVVLTYVLHDMTLEFEFLMPGGKLATVVVWSELA